jgi:putative DNA primase/helicase
MLKHPLRFESEDIGRQLVQALRGTWSGDHGMARCPSHADHTPSLSVSIKQGKLLVYCHAGCKQRDVIRALHASGLWPERTASPQVHHVLPHFGHDQPQADYRADLNRELARRIWADSRDLTGTAAETYLSCRGITVKAPATLRYAAPCYHPSGALGPAIIAAIQSSEGTITAIQRVFIRADGRGKAHFEEPKPCLGPLLNGAVRLAPATDVIGLCEGWETGLSASQLYQLPVWAALGASRMHGVHLPDSVQTVFIFADNDTAGRAAADRTASLHRRLGRCVIIQLPSFGKDFNDELLRKE